MRKHNLKKAQENFEEALNLAESFECHELKIECHRYLAEVYYTMKDIPQAYEQAKQALVKKWEFAGNSLDKDISVVLNCADELSKNHG